MLLQACQGDSIEALSGEMKQQNLPEPQQAETAAVAEEDNNAGIHSHGYRPSPISKIPEHFLLFMAAQYGYACLRNHFIDCFSQALNGLPEGEVNMADVVTQTSYLMEQSGVSEEHRRQVPICKSTLRRNLVFHKHCP